MFFVKLTPLDSNGKIRRSELSWMFEREAFMYSEILQRLNGKNPNQMLMMLIVLLKPIETSNWYPKCYLAREDLLVLEDLNLSGFKHLKHQTRLDKPLVECVLRSVAKMHADSIAYDLKIYPKTIGDIFGCYREEFGVGQDKKWFQMGLEVSVILF